jgi:hypothetical protein
MRRDLGLFVLTLSLLGGIAPTDASYQGEALQTKNACEEEETVRAILEERRHRFSSGASDKANSRLGDSVSVALLNLYTWDELRDPENIRLFLPIIRASFPPKWEGDRACNREPKVTTVFLHWLQAEARDKRLKREIAHTLAAVIRASATKERKP